MRKKMEIKPAGCWSDIILPLVEKPSRYIDRELNLSSDGYIRGGFNVALVFPDLYEIGMSHQGLRLLYEILSRKNGVGVEFVFAPWPDMEGLLRKGKEPLRSLQTGTPLANFDVVGITVPYELHYTNIVTILELSSIPLEREERKDGDPVVIAGGPCATNPLPILDALDAVFVGDAERSLSEAVDLLIGVKGLGGTRDELRGALARVDGVYVDGISKTVRPGKWILADGDLPGKPIVPSASIIHERLSVEILRGCTRGCRFCHAGMTYRPRRERSIDEITRAICEGLDASGWEEVSLLSLSTSDYSRFDELIERIGPELKKRRVSLSLPSLRPETISSSVLSASAMVRKSGFTIAPEAGTERLRRVINKEMSDDEIMKACSDILNAGWQTLKLYFMIGLPTETVEDLDGIASIVERVMRIPRRRKRFKLNISISPFVPRVQTPFQWERQASIDEISEKEKYLAGKIKHRDIQLSMREPRISALEGIFARGTSDLWPVIKTAHKKGCRFDGWRDHFRFDLWESALQEHGFSINELLEGRAADTALPWDRFGSRVSKEFLLNERVKAFRAETTEDCRIGKCSDCGACVEKKDYEAGRAGPAKGPVSQTGSEMPDESKPADGEVIPLRYRCLYSRTGLARFLSHREFINILHRALRRSGLKLSYSGGFHPLARISMGPSLAVGIEGEEEFFDVELLCEEDIAPSRLNDLLPEGIEVSSCHGPFQKSEGRLTEETRYIYRLDLDPLLTRAGGESGINDDTLLPVDRRLWYRQTEHDLSRSGRDIGVSITDGILSAGWLAGRLRELFTSGEKIIDRKGRERSCDGCGIVEEIDEKMLDIYIDSGHSPGIRDILYLILPERLAGIVRIRRKKILYLKNGCYLGPAEMVGGSSRETR
ncbi:MAG: DUF2344 domain-containing protein [Candidatus Krumholzibacteriota bacterium]|nr:DUF2344 domain-containing protein [Candidatus Krumholzibacteriota bacterium]